jgi:hypothetical protein
MVLERVGLGVWLGVDFINELMCWITGGPGLKGSSKLLRFYIFFTVVAVGCALMPFASGNYIGKVRNFVTVVLDLIWLSFFQLFLEFVLAVPCLAL